MMLARTRAALTSTRRYQEIIAQYNRDKDDAEIERVFEDLLKLHDSLDQEELRYVREGFNSESELAVYDLLSKDKASITKSDIESASRRWRRS
jgi:type I restriction enzyme R subunit